MLWIKRLFGSAANALGFYRQQRWQPQSSTSVAICRIVVGFPKASSSKCKVSLKT
jgi:hypothetical protein